MIRYLVMPRISFFECLSALALAMIGPPWWGYIIGGLAVGVLNAALLKSKFGQAK